MWKEITTALQSMSKENPTCGCDMMSIDAFLVEEQLHQI